MLLKGFDKYEEIRKEFNLVAQTTTTTTITGTPGASVSMNVTGVPVAAGTLEARVAALEQQNALLRAEFEAFKATQALQNQSFDAIIKALQAAGQAAPQVYGVAPQ